MATIIDGADLEAPDPRDTKVITPSAALVSPSPARSATRLGKTSTAAQEMRNDVLRPYNPLSRWTRGQLHPTGLESKSNAD